MRSLTLTCSQHERFNSGNVKPIPPNKFNGLVVLRYHKNSKNTTKNHRLIYVVGQENYYVVFHYQHRLNYIFQRPKVANI
jgi:hypothetical protein